MRPFKSQAKSSGSLDCPTKSLKFLIVSMTLVSSLPELPLRSLQKFESCIVFGQVLKFVVF